MCLQIAGKEQELAVWRELCALDVIFLIGIGHSLAWSWCLAKRQGIFTGFTTDVQRSSNSVSRHDMEEHLKPRLRRLGWGAESDSGQCIVFPSC